MPALAPGGPVSPSGKPFPKNNPAPAPLVPLLVQSCYSFLRGVPRPKDFVDAAKKAGQIGRAHV